MYFSFSCHKPAFLISAAHLSVFDDHTSSHLRKPRLLVMRPCVMMTRRSIMGGSRPTMRSGTVNNVLPNLPYSCVARGEELGTAVWATSLYGRINVVELKRSQVKSNQKGQNRPTLKHFTDSFSWSWTCVSYVSLSLSGFYLGTFSHFVRYKGRPRAHLHA